MSDEPQKSEAPAAVGAQESSNVMECSRLFGSWLGAENACIAMACSTGLGLLGRDEKSNPAINFLTAPGIRAIAAAPDGTLWTARNAHLEKWENVTRTAGYRAERKELYLQRLRIFTSALGIEDMAVDGHGALLYCSGVYSVIGRANTEAGSEPVWMPPFVGGLFPQNRCGLSGLGLFDTPRHCATIYAKSEQPDGWKNGYQDAGLVMAIEGAKVLAEGLCLPRSPRWRDNGLYLLNAGTAEFGLVDMATGRFNAICQCPAFPTGLVLHRQWAVISVSNQPPAGVDAGDLPAMQRFEQQGIKPFSGILLVDLRSGDIAHNASFVDPTHQIEGLALVGGCAEAVALGPHDPKLDPLLTFKKPAAKAG